VPEPCLIKRILGPEIAFMSLAGTRLGPYEVLGLIGAGGMGEVYRAHDTSLKRDVALKILPESFAADGERLARFQREAEVLASLNHPNIAGIHGLAETNGIKGSSWSSSRAKTSPITSDTGPFR
jgi:serine/threonine protein kinase